MMGSNSEPPIVFTTETLDSLPLSDDQLQSTYHSTITSSSSSFIDPPSYNDAVFSPTSHAASLRSHTSKYLSISVSDPRSEPGPSTFITYLISSTSASDSSTVRVRRRFRDFVTLADRIAESHRGLFIPPRPDKNTVESQMMQKSEFLEQRRAQLEKYLWRLAVHPVIGKSEELRLFLRTEGKLPLAPTTDVASRMLDGAVKLPKQLVTGEGAVLGREEAMKEAKGGRDLLRIFKELKQSVTNEWGGVRKVGVVVEEDRGFLERKEKVQDFELQITAASVQVWSLD